MVFILNVFSISVLSSFPFVCFLVLVSCLGCHEEWQAAWSCERTALQDGCSAPCCLYCMHCHPFGLLKDITVGDNACTESGCESSCLGTFLRWLYSLTGRIRVCTWLGSSHWPGNACVHRNAEVYQNHYLNLDDCTIKALIYCQSFS